MWRLLISIEDDVAIPLPLASHRPFLADRLFEIARNGRNKLEEPYVTSKGNAMSLRVPIVVRPLKRLVDQGLTALPNSALVDYFHAWGVQLEIVMGQALEQDPTDDPAEIDALCDAYRPGAGPGPWPAVLVLASLSEDGTHTNGILLDSDHRGACAIFLKSSAYFDGNADDRFEIVAHEIGHLLNLTHSDADETYATAMNQFDQRSEVLDRVGLWKHAIDDTPQNERAGILAFFNGGQRVPLGLPMSRACCKYLTSAPSNAIAPWGAGFRETISPDAALDLDRTVNCRVRLRSQSLTVAQPVDFTVSLTLDDTAPMALVPIGLGLRYGTLALSIQAPDGSRRLYRSRINSCSRGWRLLRAGDVISRSYSLISDSAGLLFPVPGTYVLHVHAPTLGVRSNGVSIEVAPAAGAFADARFRAFLARGLPRPDARAWKILKGLLSDDGVDPAVRAHLANQRVAKRIARSSDDHAQLIGSTAYTSPRTYEKNLLLRLARLRRGAETDRSQAPRLVDLAESALRAEDADHPGLAYLTELRKEFARKE